MKVFKDYRMQVIFIIWPSALKQVANIWSMGRWVSGEWLVDWLFDGSVVVGFDHGITIIIVIFYIP